MHKRTRIAVIGAVALSFAALTGCIGSAGSASSSDTLAPLIPTNVVPVSPASTLVTTTPSPTEGSTPEVVGEAGTTSSLDVAADDSSYTVVANDTVFRIAKSYGVVPQALADYNEWTEGIDHPIFPGDVIKIPGGGTTPTPAATTPATVTPTTEPSATPDQTTTPTTTSTAGEPGPTYVIVAGDFLASIAARSGTTVQAIIDVNGWTDGVDHLIVPGQTIKLPNDG